MGVSLKPAPVSDHRVVELVGSCHYLRKENNSYNQVGLAPSAVQARTQGHDETKMICILIDSWLRGPLREWAEDSLSEHRLKAEGISTRSPSGKMGWHLEGNVTGSTLVVRLDVSMLAEQKQSVAA